MNVTRRELRIPVSFGHLSAVQWGSPSNPPLLALHGWQDNALSFAPLANLLHPHFHIVSLDFSGHGASSHLGAGANYNAFHYLYDVLQTVQYLNWDKFTIVAHSMGAVMAIKYAAFFPTKVENLITLDVLYPSARMHQFTSMVTSDFFHMYLKLDQREAENNELKMSWEEALNQYSQSRINLSADSLELMLSRSVKEVEPNKFIFTRDHRTKMGNSLEYTRTSIDATLNELSKFEGNWLAIMNKNPKYTPSVDKISDKMLEKKHTAGCKSFEVVYLDNVFSHFFHMDQPHLVAPLITKLCDLKQKSTDF